MLKQLFSLSILGLGVLTLGSCNSGKFKKTKTGLEYKIVTDKSSTRETKVGDVLMIHYEDVVGDSVMQNTRRDNNNEPIPVQLSEPSGKYGDFMEGFLMLTEGDSAIFRVSLDSIRKNIPDFPKWIKEGSYEEFRVKVVSVKTKEEAQKDMEAKMQKQQAEMAQQAEGQNIVDERILQEFFTKNNLKPSKTDAGVYYILEKSGSGPSPDQGDMVTMNYTGKTLDGKTFDSNVDPAFGHTDPFKFKLGVGQVIRGWDNAIAQLKKGSKAKIFIPSSLGYGPMGAGENIPPNTVLMFDVEVVNFAKDTAPANQ